MACEVLKRASRQKGQSHHYRHDLESFIYVLVYAILKKEHRRLVAEDKAGAQIAKDLRKARLSEESAPVEEVPVGPNGEPLLSPLEVVTVLLTEQFGRTSLAGIAKQRGALRNDWLNFMRATKGRDDVDYVKRPTHLHWVIMNFLECVQLQNEKPTGKVLGNSSKRVKMKKQQTQWLDGKELLRFLETEVENEEQGIAVLADIGAGDSSGDEDESDDDDEDSSD
jgi:hypothetical protein